jgi:glycine betaine/choline ABC-type transport system substrate-binding protein
VIKTLKRIVAPLTVALAITGLAACGSDNNNDKSSKSSGGSSVGVIKKNAGNAGKKITIGSKNFTEEFITANVYVQALRAAGYTVKPELNLGAEQVTNRAIKSGQIDAYPEYTSTALSSFFKVKIADIPKDPNKAYQQAKTDYAKEGLTALPPTPFHNDQAVGMTKKKADELGVKKVSDLKSKAKDIVFAGSPECKQRVDCLLGLQRDYGLKFKKFIPVDIAQRYKTVDSGQAQLVEVFTTDGQLAGGKYVVLTDDKHIFPPYNSTFVVRNSVLKKLGPDLSKVVAQVQKGMTTEVMQELNSRVDIDKQEPKDVASEYLKETGLTK